jgi:uncharacterized membrane protein
LKTSPPTTSGFRGRIVFIDILRAYAILMMLQGHFVDTLLAEPFRQASSSLYSTWAFMRGMTAPIFFSVTGLVFVYLLLRNGTAWSENTRVRKGLRRGLYLIGVGYALKLCIPQLLSGQISSWLWATDVLHIIGLALITLVGIGSLHERLGGSLLIWMLVLGAGFFLMDPFFTENSWAHWPRVLAHYLTRDFGSNFTAVPWLGFACWGGALGYLLTRQPKWAYSHWFPALLVALGFTLHFRSGQLLVNLYELTGWEYLPIIFNNNYLFWRLGHVLIVMGLFMWSIPRLPRVPALLSKIGGETLTIYGVHYVLLYGTWLGVGLSSLIGYRSLSPVPTIFGAALFVLAHVVLVAHIERVRQWVYADIPAWFHLRYRRLRVWHRRYSPSSWQRLSARFIDPPTLRLLTLMRRRAN